MNMTQEEFILHFLKSSKDHYPHILEKQFPHVLKNIVAKWNSSDFSAYMADLLQTNGASGGRPDRNGFSKVAWQEIYKLAELHKTSRIKKGGR